MTRHVPRRRFGQNFLRDDAVIARIVAAVGPQADDLLVEIGPGLGALTRPLLERLNHLHVIEIDRDIVARLKLGFPAHRLTIHEGDVLKFNFSALGSHLRVVGNLPYNISTPVLFRLAQSAPSLRDAHVMLQKEVVERMTARPSSSEYGRLSVMLQYHFRMEKILDVPASAFQPAPKVESALVRMRPLRCKPETAENESLFAELVASAFAQRRKMLRNTLHGYFNARDFAELRLDPRSRAQNLAVADFVRAANYLVRKQKDYPFFF